MKRIVAVLLLSFCFLLPVQAVQKKSKPKPKPVPVVKWKGCWETVTSLVTRCTPCDYATQKEAEQAAHGRAMEEGTVDSAKGVECQFVNGKHR